MSLLLLSLMKTYTYNKNRYNVRIIGIGYFSIFLLLYGLYRLVTTSQLMYLAIVIVCCYIIFETFITCANPNKVTISEQLITFEDPRHKETYYWKDVKDFRVKAFANRKQVYIRINKDNEQLLKGRYWVYCLYFSDGDELYNFFLDKECEIHPDTIKAKNRMNSKTEKKKDN